MSENGNGRLVHGLDIPIVKLVPRNERTVGAKYVKRIEASLRAVGLSRTNGLSTTSSERFRNHCRWMWRAIQRE